MLEQAFAEVAKLPDEEQDAFAAWIVEELASEERWSQSFARSQDVLAQLAEEAVAEHRAASIPAFVKRTSPATDLDQLGADFWPDDESADDINTLIAEQRAADRLSHL